MRILALGVAAAALSLAACGGNGEGDVAGTQAEAEQVIEIVETSFALDPATVRVDQPGTYTFRAVNEADIVHTLRVVGHGVEKGTGEIPAGETAELTVTLDEAGEYDLFCDVPGHKERGMDGRLVVGGQAGEGGEQQTETQDGGGIYGGG